MRIRPEYEKKNFSRFIGRPYEQVNCWDLIREFYMEVFGVELKRYYDGERLNGANCKKLIFTNMGEFNKVPDGVKPEIGDIILLRLLGMEIHMAVYVGDARLLHSMIGAGSVMEPVEKYKNVISGFYRIGEVS